MCKRGSGGSIYATCRDRIRNILGGPASNRAMRKVIDEYGGCVHKNAAKHWEQTDEALSVKQRDLTAA